MLITYPDYYKCIAWTNSGKHHNNSIWIWYYCYSHFQRVKQRHKELCDWTKIRQPVSSRAIWLGVHAPNQCPLSAQEDSYRGTLISAQDLAENDPRWFTECKSALLEAWSIWDNQIQQCVNLTYLREFNKWGL